jgi:hypothetical protein
MRINRMQLASRRFCFAEVLSRRPAELRAASGGFAAGRRTVYGRRSAAGS